jgi:predicted protein tyrosine phosphatase
MTSFHIERVKEITAARQGIAPQPRTKTVDVLPLYQVLEITPNDEMVLISIGSRTREYDKLPEQFNQIHRVFFDDTTDPRNPSHFKDYQAKDMLAFIIRHQDKHFVVHCDAGLSRSVGVGLFMESALKYDVAYHLTVEPEFANMFVYWKLVKQFSGKKGMFIEHSQGEKNE